MRPKTRMDGEEQVINAVLHYFASQSQDRPNGKLRGRREMKATCSPLHCSISTYILFPFVVTSLLNTSHVVFMHHIFLNHASPGCQIALMQRS